MAGIGRGEGGRRESPRRGDVHRIAR